MKIKITFFVFIIVIAWVFIAHFFRLHYLVPFFNPSLGLPTIEELINDYYYHVAPKRGMSSFLGIESEQNPMDNWVMQEIISEVKPDLIIETGTAGGGTALFYATILHQVNPKGRIMTVDIENFAEEASKKPIFKEKVTFLLGDSVSEEIMSQMRESAQGKKVLVTLDSDHSTEHVLKELELYAPLVSVGSYLVVQDTNTNGHPIKDVYITGGGPWDAVQMFMEDNGQFIVDLKRSKKYVISWYPSGYLKRVNQ